MSRPPLHPEAATSLGFLALPESYRGRAGGANVLRATARVTFWGALAMALTAGIGETFRHRCLKIGTAEELSRRCRLTRINDDCWCVPR